MERCSRAKKLDMIVDVYPGLFPLGELICRGWQGPKCRFVQLQKPAASIARKFLERSVVEFLQQLLDRGIKFGKTKERTFTKSSQDPSLHDLDRYLRPWPCLWAF